MIKIKKRFFLITIPFLIITVTLCFSFIFFAEEIGNGIKNGISVLLNQLIPSLFPFMVLSSYILNFNFQPNNKGLREKICNILFKSSQHCLLPFLLGLLGGYPIGALVISELHSKKTLTGNETERLFYWCINPSPSFTITAVGTFMLGCTKAGIILYLSCVLSSLTLGILCRFLSDGKINQTKNEFHIVPQAEKLVNAVAKGSHAILGICGWVLTFCALDATFECLIQNKNSVLFLKAISEVTLGCKTLAEKGFSLTCIAALLGFGGFAVICQICVYANNCNVQIKRLICSRLINAAFSALYCSLLLKIFPQSIYTSATLTTSNATIYLYHSVFATIILITMCVVLILEVDNHRKIC